MMFAFSARVKPVGNGNCFPPDGSGGVPFDHGIRVRATTAPTRTSPAPAPITQRFQGHGGGSGFVVGVPVVPSLGSSTREVFFGVDRRRRCCVPAISDVPPSI